MADIIAYKCTALTGGTADSLDAINGNLLADNDFAFALVGGLAYLYNLNASSGAAEDSPRVIAPDTNPGNKRWILQSSIATGATTEMLVGSGNAVPTWTTATGTGAPVRATSPTLNAAIQKGPAAITSFAGTVSTSGSSTTVTFTSAADAILAGYNATNPILGATLIAGGNTRYIVSWTNATTCVVDSAVTLAGSTAITSVQLPIATFVNSSGVTQGWMNAAGDIVTAGNFFMSTDGRKIKSAGGTTYLLPYSGNTSQTLRISPLGSATEAYLQLYGQESNSVGTRGEYYQSGVNTIFRNQTLGGGSQGYISFEQDSSVRQRIDTSGNILTGGLTSAGTSAAKNLVIGEGTAPTTSPANATALWSANIGGVADKNGLHMRAEDGAGLAFGGGSIQPLTDSTTAIKINKADGTTNVMTVDTTNGNVGIGTTSPGSKLEVAGDIKVIGTTGIITLQSNTTFYDQSAATEASPLFVRVMYPGIGSNIATFSNLDPAAYSQLNIYTAAQYTTGIQARSNLNGAVKNLVLQQYGGNVGIGATSPGAQLHTTGTVRLANFGAGAATFDASGNISSTPISTTKSISYGVSWNESTDAYVRTGAATGQALGVTLADAYLPVQASMRGCLLNDDGTVNYYLSATDWTKKEDGSTASVLTGADGQVMVEIPKFWYRYTYVGTTHTWDISPVALSGFAPHPAFYKDGAWVDNRYIGAYEGVLYDTSGAAYTDGGAGQVKDWTATTGDKLSSVSGKLAVSNGTRAQFRTIAANRGTGWRQQDYDLTIAVQLLFLTEYASFYSQSVLGAGITNVTDWGAYNSNYPIVASGKGNAIGNASGTNAAASSTAAATVAATGYLKYRGIENFYGHIWKFVDGFNINDNIPYRTNVGTNFADDTASNYTWMVNNLGANVTLHNANGYPGTIQKMKYGFLAASVGASGSTKLTDYYYQAAGWRVAFFGGVSPGGVAAGAFYWFLAGGSGDAAAGIGGRLGF